MDVQQDQDLGAVAPPFNRTSDSLLIIFFKNPEKGKVKTRLAKTLGEAKALEIYKELVNHTIKITHNLSFCDKAVFYSDYIDNRDFWNNNHYKKQLQKGTDLGSRLSKSYQFSFEKGYKKVIVIGSDCKEISRQHLEEAFFALDKKNAVIGPAKDGGYYLLGMRLFYPELFLQKSWSTSKLFVETLSTLKKKKIKFHLLEILSDVDEEKDIILSEPKLNTVSIVIPTYNEAGNIGKLVKYLQEEQKVHLLEIIVADGGSLDDTVSEAENAGAFVIISPVKGRAAQMNAGAEIAKGEIVYFLHSDTFPPKHYDETIVKTLGEEKWGCFKIQFDHSNWLLNFISWFTRFNFTYFRFGDQSLFLRNSLFAAIGKFNTSQIIFEDTEIAKRLKLVSKGKVIAEPVITSARKFRENGIFKMGSIFLFLWFLYLFTIPQEKILAFYKKLIIQDKI
ncbi:MAG: TIGR04283 family arsenosugar biosynthesis glycosyltransferase [Bacteroidetes bacterium]|nr:TIGR04283 family arsenosugar biosynthesis glycosyltransferase [Bacteroidota bacterium]